MDNYTLTDEDKFAAGLLADALEQIMLVCAHLSGEVTSMPPRRTARACLQVGGVLRRPRSCLSRGEARWALIFSSSG